MSRPLVVSIPHNLGKAEARRRLASGIGQVRTQFGPYVQSLDERWSGDHLDFSIGVLKQQVAGALDVHEDHVRLEVQLPWVLAMLAEKAKALVEKHGRLMLEKK